MINQLAHSFGEEEKQTSPTPTILMKKKLNQLQLGKN